MNTNPVEFHAKRMVYLRSALHANSWYRALRCLEFASRFHTGTRKDGQTPELLHQVEQALFGYTQRRLLQDPEGTICTSLLHDVLEDYYDAGVRIEQIAEIAGPEVATAVELLTNNVAGVAKPVEIYYPSMAQSVLAAYCKAIDRIDNQKSMPEVFTAEKVIRKISETEKHVLPMLKVARRVHVEHEDALQAVKTILEQQIRMLRCIQTPDVVRNDSA